MTHFSRVIPWPVRHAGGVILLLAFLLESAGEVAAAADATGAEASYTSAALAPPGDLLVLGSQRGIEIRTWPELQFAAALPTDLVNVHDLRFSPDGLTLLAAGGSPAVSGTVEVIDWKPRQRIRSIDDHADVVYRVAWSPDGSHWVTASLDGTCQIRNARTGELVVRYGEHSRAVLGACYSRDGDTVLSAGMDHSLRIWRSRTGQHVRTLDNHTAAVNSVLVCDPTSPANAPSPHSLIATLGEDRTVRLWQPDQGRLVRFVRLPAAPRAGAWSQRDAQIVVGCNDGQIHWIDIDRAQIVGSRAGLTGGIDELLIDEPSNHILVMGASGYRILTLHQVVLRHELPETDR